jgi:hypothetical protein
MPGTVGVNASNDSPYFSSSEGLSEAKPFDAKAFLANVVA